MEHQWVLHIGYITPINMPNKLEKLKAIIELMQNDTVTPKQLGDFLQTVLKTIKDQKDGFQEISNATLLEVQKALEYIESEHGEFMAKVDEKSNEVSGISKEMKYQMAQIQKMCQEVMDCKPENGKDGKDADEEMIIDSVLSKMPDPVVLDNAGQIRDKLETLKDEDRLDASAIKNLPEFIKEDKRIGFGSMLKEAPKDGLIYGRQNRAWVEVTTGGGTWGSITGTLSNQTDLQSALNAKANDSDVVKLTGNQSIAGDKTFTGDIVLNELTASRVLITDANKHVKSSTVTTTELDYLSGVTSTVQGQYVVTTVTSTTSSPANTKDHAILLCDAATAGGNITVNLPTAVSNTAMFTIKKTDSGSNTIIIDPNSTQTIDGNTTFVLFTQYDSITLISNGSNWFII